MDEDFLDRDKNHRRKLADRIRSANKDLLPQGADIEYDPELDYLWIALAPERIGIAFPVEELGTAGLMYDPDTYEIVSLEVPFFMEFLREGKIQGAFWTEIAALIRSDGEKVHLDTKRSKRVGAIFRDLVSA